MNRSSEVEGENLETKEKSISQGIEAESAQQGLSQSSQSTGGVVEMSEKETKLMEWGRMDLLIDCEDNTSSTFLWQLKFGFPFQDSAGTSPPPGSPLYLPRLHCVPHSP